MQMAVIEVSYIVTELSSKLSSFCQKYEKFVEVIKKESTFSNELWLGYLSPIPLTK